MDKIRRQQQVINRMIRIYCRRVHHDRPHSPGTSLCTECEALAQYAHLRLERCPHGNAKPACKNCRIHCYSPPMRETMRRVMQYMGPRMILIDPLAAIRHLFNM